ncbi:MAG: hypothetical protein AAFU85_13525, partial [Planctomycetota bacterium]
WSQLMKRVCFSFLIVALLTLQARAEDPVFSGPQIGEPMPALSYTGVFGDQEGKEIDFTEASKDRATLVFFVHKRSRPAFALFNSVIKYFAKREGLSMGLVFLSDDASETTSWMSRIRRVFPEGAMYGVSPDGLDGPGAFGLNRNVTVTALVANKGKVTANFALVQPSLQVDGPKIAKAIVDITGGDLPTIEQLAGPRNMRRTDTGRDAELGTLVRAVIQKDATKDDVASAVERVEQYVSKKPAARKELGRIATRIVASDRLKTYGTEAAQEAIKSWAKKYGGDKEEMEESKR